MCAVLGVRALNPAAAPRPILHAKAAQNREKSVQASGRLREAPECRTLGGCEGASRVGVVALAPTVRLTFASRRRRSGFSVFKRMETA